MGDHKVRTSRVQGMQVQVGTTFREDKRFPEPTNYSVAQKKLALQNETSSDPK